MALVLNKKRKRREYQCDNCRRVLGSWATGINDPRAGYVREVGKALEGFLRDSRGCRRIYVHPLACSDACEDRLLVTWPKMDAADVFADDWGPDFRDADVA